MGMTKDRFFELLGPALPDAERFALHLTRNRDRAKDIVGDSIVAAYGSKDSIASGQAFLSFLFTIIRRKYYVSISRNNKLEYRQPEDFDVLYGTRISPEDLTDLNLLYDALDTINPLHKEAFVLAEIMGYQHREIAVIQDCTVANVKARIFRAKRALEKILKINNSKVNATVGVEGE